MKGDDWFVGVMNNRLRKTLEIKLDFLSEGSFEMQSWSDTKKSDKEPTSLQLKTQTIKNGDIIKIELAKNGGFVGIIRKK